MLTWCTSGDKPAMVDLQMWPHFERLPALAMLTAEPRINPDPQHFPHLAAWMTVMFSLPAVRATMQETEAHAHFLASFKTGTPAYDYGLDE
ncbi:glutathione s-transferase omega-1 [Plakobranchus ocellatus]|uniref:Glutathione s-transferase omega-1 n=1 Tax=Plakobranchus ocellatus TaxID=259542 RepID=A0AAV4DGN0_9GAST|nr:glutathione s-transferase omega-1 [Plakobranchus ocellatus]